jgi:phosphoglucosamine mutase
VLLRRAPETTDPDERAELIKLARAQAETAEGTITPQQETGFISDHLRVVRYLLELEAIEQSITQTEPAVLIERVRQISNKLLLAAGRTQDPRLGDAVMRRVPGSLYARNFLISHEKPDYPEPARSYPTAERDRPSGRDVFVQTRPPRLFGTDGVRGIAGRDLSAHLAVDLAIAAAQVLARPDGGGTPAVAIIGRDSSSSGQFLESAIIAGLTSSGVDVIRIGVAPAAAVAFLTAMHDAQLGVSLSASHSRAPDNGIKLFGPGGYKPEDSVEDDIERKLVSAREHGSLAEPPAVFGEVRDGSAGIRKYISHVLSSLPDSASKALAGLRVVVDCANGAASAIAPQLLREAGAEIIEIGVSPDGQNINVGSGSTDPETLIAEVKRRRADAGVAYDGDADGCLAVDHHGRLIDGDQILATLALDLADQGKLAHRTVVMTVMANLGFRLAMQNAGIRVVETQVGDRYLADEIRKGGYSLGGTQSGRIIIADHATGPDGLLVSLNLLAIAVRSGKTLASVTNTMTRHPQVLKNVPIPEEHRDRVTGSSQLISAVEEAVEEAAAELGEHGRIVLRPSGTEPVVRVMVEDDDGRQAERLAQQLVDFIRDLV